LLLAHMLASLLAHIDTCSSSCTATKALSTHFPNRLSLTHTITLTERERERERERKRRILHQKRESSIHTHT